MFLLEYRLKGYNYWDVKKLPYHIAIKRYRQLQKRDELEKEEVEKIKNESKTNKPSSSSFRIPSVH